MSDEFTPIVCRACGGRCCSYCGNTGSMSPEQLGAWMRHKSGSRPSVGGRVATTRLDNHRIIIFERLVKAWDKMPDARFGELLVEALGCQSMTPEVLRTINDKRLADIVEHYVLLGTTKPGT